MSNSNYTAVLLVLDNSGSMNGSRTVAMQKALHGMLETQSRKLAGYLTVDVSYYDNYLYYNTKFADPLMLYLDYKEGGGGTSTVTCMHKAVSAFDTSISELTEDKRPGHVVVIVATDGDSGNTSLQSQLQVLVQSKIKSGWDFVFLDASGRGTGYQELSIPKENVITHRFDSKGMEKMVTKLNGFVEKSRAKVVPVG
jgi:uncharacterized protein YegL